MVAVGQTTVVALFVMRTGPKYQPTTHVLAPLGVYRFPSFIVVQTDGEFLPGTTVASVPFIL